jgi:hypothetical protein
MAFLHGADTGGFLTPVLKGVEAQISYLGGFGVIIDTKNTTLIVRLVIVYPMLQGFPPV